MDWSSCTLSGANLSGANLTGANLTGANLSGANLLLAFLSGANLSGANLSGATLTGATLNSANLSGATLTGATLNGATLTGATLTGATLTRASLTRANLTGAFVACGTGGALGSSIGGVPLGLPSGWSLVGGVLTVPVVPCATVSLDVPAPVSVAVPVTVRATVAPVTATGSVEFLANGTSLGTAPVTGGVATLAWTPAAPGTVTLVAKYTATNIPRGGAASAETTKAVTVATAPGAPTGVIATAGDAQARVSWTAPGSDGGSPVTGYVVQQSFDAGASWTAAAGSPVAASVTSMVVKSLANGVSVSFRVAAVNTAGTGPYSTPSSAVRPTAGVVTPPAPPTTTPTTTTPTTSPVTSVTRPGKVAGLKAKNTRKRTVTLRWQAPSTGSPAVTYQYRAKGITKWKTTTSTKATVKSTKRIKGKKVTFQVRAQNSAGTGAAASKRIKITR